MSYRTLQTTNVVFRTGDRLKVSRINADPVSAQMIKIETAGDGAHEGFKRETVGANITTTKPKNAVTGESLCALPIPTTSIGIDDNLLPEALFRGKLCHVG